MPFLHRISVVRVYLSIAATTQDPAGQDPHQARRAWKEVFQVMKGKDLHPRLLYPAKLSFIMEEQIKCFPDKVKLKEFIIIIKSLSYEKLKGLI